MRSRRGGCRHAGGSIKPRYMAIMRRGQLPASRAADIDRVYSDSEDAMPNSFA